MEHTTRRDTILRTRKLQTRRLLRLAVAGGLLVAAAACGGGDGGGGGGASPGGSGEPKPGGDLTFACGTDQPTLDMTAFAPQGISALGCVGMKTAMIFDLLVYTNDEGEIEMGTAESLESDDGVTWSLVLRPDIEFSDGTPYDADAVAFNWRRMADPATGATSQASAELIAEMTTVSPTELTITLTEPNAAFPYVVAGALAAIGSPTAIQELGDDGFGQKPVGAGPFVVSSWTPDSEILFVRNDTYWNAPKPYLDTVRIAYIQDMTQLSNTFVSGGSEAALVSDIVEAGRITDSRNDATVLQTEVSGGRSLLFNTSKAPFDDPVARQAVAFAIDRQSYIDVLEGGEGTPAWGLFAESSPFFDDAFELDQDLARAQDLLTQYKEDHGQSLSFTILTSDTNRKSIEFIQAQLNQLDDISVEVEVIAGSQVGPRLREGNFDAGGYKFALIDPEPVVRQLLLSTSGNNWSQYDSAEMDAALEAGQTALDLDERRAAYEEVQAILTEDMPLTFYARASVFNFFDKDLAGVTIAGDGLALLDGVWWEQ